MKTIRASQSNPRTGVTVKDHWHRFGTALVPVTLQWMGAPRSHGRLKRQKIGNEAYLLRLPVPHDAKRDHCLFDEQASSIM